MLTEGLTLPGSDWLASSCGSLIGTAACVVSFPKTDVLNIECLASFNGLRFAGTYVGTVAAHSSTMYCNNDCQIFVGLTGERLEVIHDGTLKVFLSFLCTRTLLGIEFFVNVAFTLDYLSDNASDPDRILESNDEHVSEEVAFLYA